MSGNASNDQSQSKLVEKISDLADEFEDLKMQINVQGALRAWEFCDGKEEA